MKRALRAAVSTLFVLAMLGGAFAQHVQADFDHQANFSLYKKLPTPSKRCRRSFGRLSEAVTTDQDYKEVTLVVDM